MVLEGGVDLVDTTDVFCLNIQQLTVVLSHYHCLSVEWREKGRGGGGGGGG